MGVSLLLQCLKAVVSAQKQSPLHRLKRSPMMHPRSITSQVSQVTNQPTSQAITFFCVNTREQGSSMEAFYYHAYSTDEIYKATHEIHRAANKMMKWSNSGLLGKLLMCFAFLCGMTRWYVKLLAWMCVNLLVSLFFGPIFHPFVTCFPSY